MEYLSIRCCVVILLVGSIFSHCSANLLADKQALLDFVSNMPPSRPLNWNRNSSSVCTNWTGVTCNDDQSRVIALQLPAFRFRGSIPPNTLSRLTALQILSLGSNRISGPFPADFRKLRDLTALQLQSNNFSGHLPVNFTQWKGLKIVNLSRNGFIGTIPISITSLTQLAVLDLSSNSLTGEIPNLDIPSLQQLNLSNNNLSNSVPPSLQRFPNSAFIGNALILVHENSTSPIPPTVLPNPQLSQKVKKHRQPAMLGISLGSCALGFVLLAILMMVCCAKRGVQSGLSRQLQKGEEFSKKRAPEDQEKNRLVFFESGNLALDLEDLLRASADVLGKGAFGMTYRAALEDSATMVVKRLKEVAVTKKEFEQQVEIVGSIRHENVTPLRAYYHSKDETFMMYDYYGCGSVSKMLHGKGGEGRTVLDWTSRLKIAIGAARGIAHIHTLNGGKLVHGNVKASNVFLNSQQYGCISDFGLATLMGPVNPTVRKTLGYCPPEVTNLQKATQASDVYSFGVFLLELLTAKCPTQAMGCGEVVHLVKWVHSVVREEWTAEVFDVELLRQPNIEEELLEVLQIGVTCVVREPEKRPKMQEVVKMLENVRQFGNTNQPSLNCSTLASPLHGSETGSSSLPQ